MSNTEVKSGMECSGPMCNNDTHKDRQHQRDGKAFVDDQQDLILIWLDERIRECPNRQQPWAELQKISPNAVLFTDAFSCLNYMRVKIDKKILLVIDEDTTEAYLLQLNGISALSSVIIYSTRSSRVQADQKKCQKPIQIHHNKDELLKSIEIQIYRAARQHANFSVFAKQDETLIRDVTHHSASLLWFHILLDTFQHLPKTDESKKQMINFCKTHYENGDPELNKIQDFEETYRASDAILWYTKNSFLYRLLNKALRTDDVYLLYLLRYYIIDLYQQIKEKTGPFLLSCSDTTLYRGQLMRHEEFEKLEANCGCLISPNGFFSTTRDISVALCYAGEDDPKHRSVLFEIKIDLTLLTTSLVGACDIEAFSRFPSEKEILFNVGATFKLESITYNNEWKVWHAKIVVDDTGLGYVEEYLQSIRKDLTETNATRLFGKLLINMGQYSKAEEYYRNALQSLPEDHDDRPSLYHGLGYINYERGNYTDAIMYDQKGYQKRKELLPADHLDVARSAVNLGCDHLRNGDHQIAMELLQEALNIRIKYYSGDNHANVAIVLASMGENFIHLNDYQNASNYLTRALKIFETVLPSKHARIASTLIKIGCLQEKKLAYDQALEYYHRAHTMAEEILRADHPSLRKYFLIILNLYKRLGYVDRALDFAKKKLSSQKIALPQNHPNIFEIQSIIDQLTTESPR